MALSDKNTALRSNARPSSTDVRAQQMGVFPLDAFEFTNPNKKKATDADIKLKMKDGWTFDIGTINFTNLDTSLSGTLEQNLLRVEDNSNQIKKVDRGLALTSQTVFENGATATAEIELLTGITDGLTESVNNISDDGIVSPSEKTEAKRLWDNIIDTYPTVKADAEAVATVEDPVSTVAYTAAYNALNIYLNTTLDLFNNMNEATTIVRATWDSKWNTYYAEEVKLTGESTKSVFATAGLKAEIKNANGTTATGAYLQLNANMPVGGGDATSSISLIADQVYIGDVDGNPKTLDGVIEVIGNVVTINGSLSADTVAAKRINAEYFNQTSAGFYIMRTPTIIASSMTNTGIFTDSLRANKIVGPKSIVSRTSISSATTQNGVYDAVTSGLIASGSNDTGYYSCSGSITSAATGKIFPISWFYYSKNSYVQFQLTTSSTLTCYDGNSGSISFSFLLGF